MGSEKDLGSFEFIFIPSQNILNILLLRRKNRMLKNVFGKSNRFWASSKIFVNVDKLFKICSFSLFEESNEGINLTKIC